MSKIYQSYYEKNNYLLIFYLFQCNQLVSLKYFQKPVSTPRKCNTTILATLIWRFDYKNLEWIVIFINCHLNNIIIIEPKYKDNRLPSFWSDFEDKDNRLTEGRDDVSEGHQRPVDAGALCQTLSVALYARPLTVWQQHQCNHKIVGKIMRNIMINQTHHKKYNDKI